MYIRTHIIIAHVQIVSCRVEIDKKIEKVGVATVTELRTWNKTI